MSKLLMGGMHKFKCKNIQIILDELDSYSSHQRIQKKKHVKKHVIIVIIIFRNYFSLIICHYWRCQCTNLKIAETKTRPAVGG